MILSVEDSQIVGLWFKGRCFGGDLLFYSMKSF
jgi:hypothetical protein